MNSHEFAWFHIENEADIATPALLFYRERIEHNLQLMLQIAGGPERLRPHVKTHKCGQLIQRQVELGITKFKCSTVAEVEMTADAGGTDIMLAMPAVGANAHRLAELAAKFPTVRFSTIADDEETIRHIAAAAQQHRVNLPVFLELDCGMSRTGIVPGFQAKMLAKVIKETPRVGLAGLHAYDGHIHDADLETRRRLCDEAFAPILEFKKELQGEGLIVKELVAGGSPTFGILAQHADRTLSPGTTVLWDFGYGDKLDDLPFQPAAVLLTRVVSKPAPDCVCLDLGHKAVAAEMSPPRALFPSLPDAEAVSHSEEHLVLRTAAAAGLRIGDVLYAIPWHVCPTVALHQEAWLVHDGRAVERWTVEARTRRITV